PFLKMRDFRLYEDGVEQDIESFNSVETPFHVALVLDTSRSTRFKMEDIQDAAFAFVKQLKRDDRVMVVSFDSKVRFHCDFTSDYDELRPVIYETRTGGSTNFTKRLTKWLTAWSRFKAAKPLCFSPTELTLPAGEPISRTPSKRWRNRARSFIRSNTTPRVISIAEAYTVPLPPPGRGRVQTHFRRRGDVAAGLSIRSS